MENLGPAGILIILVGGFALYIWSLFFVYRDAEARGVMPLLPVVLVALAAFPLSFIAWLLLRPAKTADHG